MQKKAKEERFRAVTCANVHRQRDTPAPNQSTSIAAPTPIKRTGTVIPPLAEGHAWVERITHVDQWTCTRCCAFAKLVTNWFMTHDRQDRYRRTYWLYAETKDAGQYARPTWTVRAGVCR